MTSPEGIGLEHNMESVPDGSVKEEPTFEEELTDRFINFLDKEPGAEEVLHEIRARFNEMETVTKRIFDASLESSRPYKRIKEVEMFAGRTALDYIALHKSNVEMLELADHLSDEEKETLFLESHKTAVFYEGHTLLSYYANRGNIEKKKSIDALTRNTENAALQQSMARYYLRHRDMLPEVEGKLDSYGKRAFGSQAEYGAFKRGVVSLADAHQHLEAHGYHVFFPPPRMDAEDEIDLICVDESIPDAYVEWAQEFFQEDFSKQDLVHIPAEILDYVHVAQVKTRHNLRRTYGNIGTQDAQLEDLVQKMSLDRRFFDGVDDIVFENTVILSSDVESVTSHNSRATIFSCTSIPDRSYTYRGSLSRAGIDDMDRNTRQIRDDIQELGTFMGKISNLGSIYIFVEEEGGENSEHKGFY